MTTQAALIAEAIAGMKRRLRRDEDSSGSDDSIDKPTNRGNKLKRHARYVRKGQLLPADGLRVHKRKIEHAGYQRYIVSRNPKRYDSEGEEISEYDEEDSDATVLEENPYGDIQLEKLLAPLTNAADLPNHPSLATPFISSTLTEMTLSARETLHKEQALLYRIKNLMTKFRGDDTWVPCSKFETEKDIGLFPALPELPPPLPDGYGYETDDSNHDDEALSLRLHDNSQEVSHEQINGDISSIVERLNKSINKTVSSITINGKDANDTATKESSGFEQDGKVSVDAANANNAESSSGKEPTKAQNSDGQAEERHDADKEEPVIVVNGSLANGVSLSHEEDRDKMDVDVEANSTMKEEEVDGSGSAEETLQPVVHRMTTRAQAQHAASEKTVSPRESRERSVSVDTNSSLPVHPLFLLPDSCHPDASFGLPPEAAEDMRRLLLLFVQKQEEVVRGAQQLYIGLMKADRLRHQVFRWCKFDGHVGELSDGEDWYDKEEWKLDEDLKKGIDEEELEAEAHAKKTRRGRG